MNIEPADLPFRKLDADRKFDALAYCPLCCTTEVQITKTFTSHWNLIAHTEQDGFRVSVIPTSSNAIECHRYNLAGPWQFVILLRCANNHDFELKFMTHNGLTWAEVEYDGHRRFALPTESSQPPPPAQ